MKNTFSLRLIAILLAALFSSQANAQLNFYGTATDNETFRATHHLNGFYYVSGQSNGQATLSKINAATQALIWTKQFPGFAGETIVINDVIESHSGNIIIAGNTESSVFWQFQHIVVTEISQNTGDILQSRRISLNNINSGNHRISSVRMIRSANVASAAGTVSCSPEYILQCRRANGGGAFDEMMLMKLDYTFVPIWGNIYADNIGEWESYAIVPTPSGGAVVCGLTTTGSWYGYLMEVDAFGNVVTTKGYKTSGGDWVAFLNMVRDYNSSGTGNFVVTGGFRPGGGGNFRGNIAKINASTYAPTGAGTWSKSFARPNEDVLFSGLTQFQVANGSIYTGYFTPDINNGMFEPRVLRVNAVTGAFQGYRDLGGPNPGSAVDQLRLATNGTNKVSVTTGMPGTIGLDDAYQIILPPTLSDACAGITTQAAVNQPLTVTGLPIVTTNVTQDLSSLVFCGPFPLTWLRSTPPCPPYGNRPGQTATERTSASPNADFELFQNAVAAKQSAPAKERRAISEETVSEFEIYPNPAGQSVEISFPTGEGLDRVLHIFDLNGKEIRTEIVNDAEQTTLDISQLPQGVYMVRLGNGVAQKLTKL